MNTNQRGVSLFELMIVIVLLTVIMGAIFSLIAMATTRSSAEQAKLDMFQECREFMDQMSRDLRQAGYPSSRSFALGVLATPVETDARTAVGLVKVASNELWFEGDAEGNGTVSVVHYWLDPSTSNNCPCLKRSQLPKIAGHPLTEQSTPVYQTEVQNVRNTNIFSAFLKGHTGTPLALPIDFSNNADTIAGVDTIQVVLTVQSPTIDAQTHKKPVTTLAVSVNLNNCSQAANGEAMSCN